MTRLPNMRTLVLALAAASVACGMIIGLDERGARPAGAADASADVGPTSDAGKTYCSTADGSFFCDDFDLPGQKVSARWAGYEQLQIKSPFVIGDGDASIVYPAEPSVPPSPPGAFEAALLDTLSGGITTGGLLHRFDGKRATQGFILSFFLQVNDFEVSDASSYKDVGPEPALYNEPGIAIGGIFTLAGKFYGVGIAISDGNVLMTEGLEGEVNDNYARVGRVNLVALRDQTWTRLSVMSGPRDRVLAHAASLVAQVDAGGADPGQLRVPPTCPDGPYLTLAWTSLSPAESGCIFADATKSPVANGMDFVLLLNVSSRDPARARFRFDNVRMDPLP